MYHLIICILLLVSQPLWGISFGLDELLTLAKASAQPSESRKVPAARIKELCKKIDDKNTSFGWNIPKCNDYTWTADTVTRGENPLIYMEIGSGSKVTLIFSGVHPDEITPIPVGFRLVEQLKAHPALSKDRKIIIAPLVNPDGYLSPRLLRTNLNGVDLNRNFNTKDWFADAHDAWTKRDRRDRYFPGWLPESEVETHFQSRLIAKYKPEKILSLHAPLGLIDYDIYYDDGSQSDTRSRRLKDFASEIAKRSTDYRIINFNIFPGSLGNFAGVEQQIPTFTIELKDADPNNFEKHWKNLGDGLIFASVTQIEHFDVRGISQQ